MKILILTKNYPPQLGGIEKYCGDLVCSLQKQNTIFLIKSWSRNQYLFSNKKKFPYFIFYYISEFFRLGFFLFKTLTIWCVYAYKSDLIWSMDGSITFISFFLGYLFNKKTRVTLHGLDVSWNNHLYQFFLKNTLFYIDEIYVVSQSIKKYLSSFYLPNSHIHIEWHSLDKLNYPVPDIFSRKDFLSFYGVPHDKILLLSIWRFVEKKWFHWFIREVLPFLDASIFHYVLAGFWDMEEIYLQLAKSNSLNNITFIGPIGDPIVKAKLYSSADYFIMPNIPVMGDCEWFGIVLLEAYFYNLKIIASSVDGIKESAPEGSILLPPEISTDWVLFLTSLWLSITKHEW